MSGSFVSTKYTAVCHFSFLLHLLMKGIAHVHVSLSWPPLGVHVGALQENVWQDAQDIWMRVLLEPWHETNGIKLLVDNASLVETLRELGPTIFRKNGGRTSAIEGFLSWLYSGVSTDLLLKRTHLTLTLFRSLLILEGACCSPPSPLIILILTGCSNPSVHNAGATVYRSRVTRISTTSVMSIWYPLP